MPPRYRSSYFQHIWGNGYAAGYYAYLWTEMLADDAFQWFTEHGGLTAETASFRDMILSRGNSQDLEAVHRLARQRAEHRTDADQPRAEGRVSSAIPGKQTKGALCALRL